MFLLLVSGVAAQSPGTTLIEIPADLGPINWQLTPAAALATDPKSQGVVWLGAIENVTATPRGDDLEIEWHCRHLQYSSPGPEAIAAEPVAIAPGETGHFLVNLILQAPAEAAEALRSQFAGAGQFMLAAGFVEGAVTREGRTLVFLHTA